MLYSRFADTRLRVIITDPVTGGPTDSLAIAKEKAMELSRGSLMWESRPRFGSPSPHGRAITVYVENQDGRILHAANASF